MSHILAYDHHHYHHLFAQSITVIMCNTAKKTVGWDSEATLSCCNNCL